MCALQIGAVWLVLQQVGTCLLTAGAPALAPIEAGAAARCLLALEHTFSAGKIGHAAILISIESAACPEQQLSPLLALQGRLLSPRPWFNMSLQGVQPLRQQATAMQASQAGAAGAQAWQLQLPGRAGACTAAGAWQPWLQAQVSHETAFEGGGCLRLQGEGEGMATQHLTSPLLCCYMAGATTSCNTRVQAVCISDVSSDVSSMSNRCIEWRLHCQLIRRSLPQCASATISFGATPPTSAVRHLPQLRLHLGKELYCNALQTAYKGSRSSKNQVQLNCRA